ncbi:Ankyrin repeat [Cupriavidus gilardii CR3]|uniref:Ankyrin repeat domain-containing protein n=1 Tax=Cupriavidus gilardii TaxID=82541 RepID=A0A849B931_9BURK|nr:Ankyrin repeat [Cupriavidus gilardii CR3]KAB0597592.1 ankyrin repeat domain-containing protein [Cupriavidus gilardii]QQE09668.1 ankyrin repeat domain-containing protein [Cupriavidus sp. ISTL7]MCT9014587.1 ankyrin repeat domain-containing protein [Cupriavidus gilardii]MCT9054307.1 ankyrin repeat domain-containing protein [Cupriavidus gilardii]
MLRARIPLYLAILIAMLITVPASAGPAKLDARLHAAAAQGDAAAIALLLKQGANLETRDDSGATPLLIATRHNHIDAARALIDAGANVNAKDRIQDSAYLHAGARGYNEILKMTLTHGADLKSTNRYGGTALIPAAERGHVQTVRILIAAGVDVNHINRLHWTALLEAIILGDGGPSYTEIVRLLVNAKADVNIPDGKGVTALQHARQRGYRDIERILVKAGARQ